MAIIYLFIFRNIRQLTEHKDQEWNSVGLAFVVKGIWLEGAELVRGAWGL